MRLQNSVPDKSLWYKCNSSHMSYFMTNKKPIFSFRFRLYNQILLYIEELRALSVQNLGNLIHPYTIEEIKVHND